MSAKNLIGPTVQKLRVEKGWTETDLADELGKRGWSCTAAEVTDLEAGISAVSDAQFLVLGYVFGVDHAELFPSELD